MINYLIQKYKQQYSLDDRLFNYVFDGNDRNIIKLLDQGADPNYSKNDYTVLYIAVLEARLNIISILLQHGADINKTSKNGETPIYLAARNGYDEVVQLLLTNNADIERQTFDGVSPLQIAERLGRYVSAILLRDRLYSDNKTNRTIVRTVVRTDDCMICLDSFGDGDEINQYLCGHRMHLKCYNKWSIKFPDKIDKCLSRCD
jgi:hypothetical protein